VLSLPSGAIVGMGAGETGLALTFPLSGTAAALPFTVT
jgi:hypothetical protein